ncbi:F-box only protein 36b isoform X2 [Poecilia latipinna]|uniref:F-box only protein 36b isoform X2 n=1 Tax=Poecilia latipinna TaxID=48699 RepID=UPI00072E100F|nr:PREDICTED: F-box only protein 36-like isoform X2 [Poecilia latipinna]XP_016535521.1 PREDICTED: F-box only protein 36-like isoform X2 [Poecilia formosa]
MASLLTDPLFETYGRGPPPIKDYYHFFVTKSEIIWRWWKISPRMVYRHTKPGEVKESLSDFLEDTDLQREVRVVFGDHVLEFTMALCEGRYNYLDRLSDSLLLRIINFLELEDVDQLGQTSRKFQQLCGSEEFWEQAMRRHCCSISDEVASLAKEIGWRTVFFTNKLHLQKLLSRRRKMSKEQHEGPGTDEATQSGESSTESFKEEIDFGAGAGPDFDNIDPHVDSTEPHVDSTEPHVDSTEPHVDSTEPHIDNISNHNATSGSNVGV